MKRQRLEPPYKAYALGADGTRRPFDAHSIVVELRPGIEVEIELAPHPDVAGRQLIMFTPPRAHMETLYEEGKVDDFAAFFGAQNVLHVLVERRTRQRPADRGAAQAGESERVQGPGRGAKGSKKA